MTKTRKTIGVMVGGITDDFTRFLCKGLREAAKEQDSPFYSSPKISSRYFALFTQ
jgi:hypothetical protein